MINIINEEGQTFTKAEEKKRMSECIKLLKFRSSLPDHRTDLTETCSQCLSTSSGVGFIFCR